MPNKTPKTKSPIRVHQRRPNLRATTQVKIDAIRRSTGWDSDTETVDRLADFFLNARGIQVDVASVAHRK